MLPEYKLNINKGAKIQTKNNSFNLEFFVLNISKREIKMIKIRITRVGIGLVEYIKLIERQKDLKNSKGTYSDTCLGERIKFFKVKIFIKLCLKSNIIKGVSGIKGKIRDNIICFLLSLIREIIIEIIIGIIRTAGTKWVVKLKEYRKINKGNNFFLPITNN